MAGRWYALGPWSEHLAAIDYPPENIHLRVLSNSDDELFHVAARERLEWLELRADYASVEYHVDPAVPRSTRAFVEREKTHARHAEVIAALYNALYARIETEWFLTLEDDVLAPPDAILRLLDCYTRFPRAGWAAGVLIDRHGEGPLLWDVELERVFPAGDECQEEQLQLRPVRQPWGVRPIGCGHMGLTLFRRSISEQLRDREGHVFRARSPVSIDGGVLGCDLLYCLDLSRRGYQRICNYNVRAGHLDSRGTEWRVESGEWRGSTGAIGRSSGLTTHHSPLTTHEDSCRSSTGTP